MPNHPVDIQLYDPDRGMVTFYVRPLGLLEKRRLLVDEGILIEEEHGARHFDERRLVMLGDELLAKLLPDRVVWCEWTDKQGTLHRVDYPLRDTPNGPLYLIDDFDPEETNAFYMVIFGTYLLVQEGRAFAQTFRTRVSGSEPAGRRRRPELSRPAEHSAPPVGE